jgi:hypothetical protein
MVASAHDEGDRNGGTERHGRKPFCRAGQEGTLRPFQSRARPVADGLRDDPPGCLRPKHQNRSSTGRFSGSRLIPTPDRLPACWQWLGFVRRPGRLQRRPRDGFSPSSLLSPGPFPSRGHLSRGVLDSIRFSGVKRGPIVATTHLRNRPLVTGVTQPTSVVPVETGRQRLWPAGFHQPYGLTFFAKQQEIRESQFSASKPASFPVP